MSNVGHEWHPKFTDSAQLHRMIEATEDLDPQIITLCYKGVLGHNQHFELHPIGNQCNSRVVIWA